MTALQAHLDDMDACREARRWAGKRTTAQAWAECKRADWMLWWLLRDRPDQSRTAVLLMVEQIRSRTLPRVPPEHREVCERALDAARTWAYKPTKKLRLAADTISWDTKAAADVIVAASRTDASAIKAAVRAAASVADAVTEAGASSAVMAAGAAAMAAAYAVAAVGHGGTARAAERRLWCAAIRQRWPEPPWKEATEEEA